MSGLAIITEACIDVKDRACVDVCPVQCIYEYDSEKNVLFSEVQAGQGVENTHQPNPDAIAIFGDSMLYVNLDECTSCTACYQPDVCPVGAIYSEELVPDGSTKTRYNSADSNKGHDHTFFIEHSGRSSPTRTEGGRCVAAGTATCSLTRLDRRDRLRRPIGMAARAGSA